MLINRLFKCLTMTIVVVMLSACGSSDNDTGSNPINNTGEEVKDLKKTGTINFTFDNKKETYYTFKVDNLAGTTNSSILERRKDDVLINVRATPEKQTGDMLNFGILFPNSILKAGVFTENPLLQYVIGKTSYLNVGWEVGDRYLVTVNKIKDNGSSVHVEGEISNVNMIDPATGNIKLISIDFNIDASETVIKTGS